MDVEERQAYLAYRRAGMDHLQACEAVEVGQGKRGDCMHPDEPHETINLMAHKTRELAYSRRSEQVIDLALRQGVALDFAETLDRSPKKNWVEKAGGLDPYLRRIAIHLHEKGHSISQSIRMAWGIVRRWGSSGQTKAWGKPAQVTAKTRAKAAAASANMEAKRGKAKAMSKVFDAEQFHAAHPGQTCSRWQHTDGKRPKAVACRRKGDQHFGACAKHKAEMTKGVKTPKELKTSVELSGGYDMPTTYKDYRDGSTRDAKTDKKVGKGGPGRKGPSKPGKPTQRKRAANKSERAQNWKEENHKRKAAGSPAGGEFDKAGSKSKSKSTGKSTTKKASAKKATTSTKNPAKDTLANKKDPAKMSDAELIAATRQAYGYKSSDPAVVKRRIQIAAQMARRNKDVKKYGAKGGGITEKKVAKKTTKRRTVKASNVILSPNHVRGEQMTSVVTLGSGRTVDLSGLTMGLELAKSKRRETAKAKIRAAVGGNGSGKARGEFKKGDGQSTTPESNSNKRKGQGDGKGQAKGNKLGSPKAIKGWKQTPDVEHPAQNKLHKGAGGPSSDMPMGPGHKGRGRKKMSDPTKSKFPKGMKMSRPFEESRGRTVAVELGVPASVLRSKSPKTPNSNAQAKKRRSGAPSKRPQTGANPGLRHRSMLKKRIRKSMGSK